jgi:hypothetical protein
MTLIGRLQNVSKLWIRFGGPVRGLVPTAIERADRGAPFGLSPARRCADIIQFRALVSSWWVGSCQFVVGGRTKFSEHTRLGAAVDSFGRIDSRKLCV